MDILDIVVHQVIQVTQVFLVTQLILVIADTLVYPDILPIQVSQATQDILLRLREHLDFQVIREFQGILDTLESADIVHTVDLVDTLQAQVSQAILARVVTLDILV